jgi:hypothetical protein
MPIYKYLSDKLEGSHGRIAQLCVLAVEVMRDSAQKYGALSDFADLDPVDICKVLGWKTTDEVVQSVKSEIDDKCLASMMCRYDRDGFLAGCNYDIPEDINFDENGNPRSWRNHGVMRVEWVYGHTIGEVVEKCVSTGEKLFESWCKEAKEKQAVKV